MRKDLSAQSFAAPLWHAVVAGDSMSDAAPYLDHISLGECAIGRSVVGCFHHGTIKWGDMAMTGWQVWALASAVFAALTAIFGKIGVENINSNFATLIRTGVILMIVCGTVVSTRAYQALGTISYKTYGFLILSGIATGLSWLCYYRALQIGPTAGVVSIDKLSVVFVALFSVLALSERLSLVNWVGVAMIAAGAILIGLRNA